MPKLHFVKKIASKNRKKVFIYFYQVHTFTSNILQWRRKHPKAERASSNVRGTICSAQTHKSISFIWIVWSTLYVYLWPSLKVVYHAIQKQIIKHVKNVLTLTFLAIFLRRLMTRTHEYELKEAYSEELSSNQQTNPPAFALKYALRW